MIISEITLSVEFDDVNTIKVLGNFIEFYTRRGDKLQIDARLVKRGLVEYTIEQERKREAEKRAELEKEEKRMERDNGKDRKHTT